MNQNIYDFTNTINSNTNNLLYGIMNDLQKVKNDTHENLTIKRIGDIIIKMNYIINENKKNSELIIKHISLLQNQMNKNFQEIKINNINKQEIRQYNGRYVGQVINGLKEGKGIFYFNNGDKYVGDFINDKVEGKGICFYQTGNRYEGDFRNDKREGKGIYYFINGNRYEGNFRNNEFDGKGIMYYHNGGRYEGDFKNGKFEGKGIYYHNNGDRMMGNYLNNKPIGKHVELTKAGEIKSHNY